jgi:translation initiation factor 1
MIIGFDNDIASMLDDEFDSKNVLDTPIKQIHIQKNQRKKDKCTTNVLGLPEELDLKKILKAFKKIYNTNGAILEDNILMVQGDKRSELEDFLVKYKICEKKDIVIHGV